MRVIDKVGRAIDYRLNILGVRVWENACQLIARSGKEWSPLGPRWDLPVEVPQNADDLKLAAADTLRLTAYQYNAEHPGSDIVDVLSRAKNFGSALSDAANTNVAAD